MTSRTLKLSFLIRACWYAITHPTTSKSRGYMLFLSRTKFFKLLCSSVVETIATFGNNWIPWILGLMISILTTSGLLGYWTCRQMTARSSSVIELVSFPKGETRLYVTMISHGKHFLNDIWGGWMTWPLFFKRISMKGSFFFLFRTRKFSPGVQLTKIGISTGNGLVSNRRHSIIRTNDDPGHW